MSSSSFEKSTGFLFKFIRPSFFALKVEILDAINWDSMQIIQFFWIYLITCPIWYLLMNLKPWREARK